MARRRKPQPEPLGSTTFHGLDEMGGEIIPPKPHPMFALTSTQTFALNGPDEGVYTVERRTLFGPPTQLYRVTRTEDGAVHTLTLTKED